jgi:hypothetical protein
MWRLLVYVVENEAIGISRAQRKGEQEGFQKNRGGG